MPDGDALQFGKMSRRQVGMKVIESALARMGGCMAALSRLIDHSPAAIARYREGSVLPKQQFFLDLFDKVPGLGVEFRHVASPLGFGRIESRDPRKFRRFSSFFVAVRLQERETREIFAAKLGVSGSCVRDIEHGLIPDAKVIARFARVYLAPALNASALTAAFPVLNPCDKELALRRKVLIFQGMDHDVPARPALERELATELMETARRMAYKASLQFGRVRDADEVCGEAVFHVMRRFEVRQGLILPYLKKVVGAMVRELRRRDLQSGAAALLKKYGTRYRESWSELVQELEREPTEREMIHYSGLSEGTVLEVSWALRAGFADLVDDWGRRAPRIADVLHPYDEENFCSDLEAIERVRRLPRVQQELLLMRFIDDLEPDQIAWLTGRTETEVDLKLRWAVAQLGG